MAQLFITSPLLEMEHRIDVFLTATSDFEPMFRRLDKPWADSRRDEFRTSGGGTWPNYLPSEDGYVGYKRAVTGKTKLLRFDRNPRARRLFKSLTQPNHPDFVWVVSPLTVRMGTSVVYAAKHLTGGYTPKWGGTTFPKRPFLRVGNFNRRVSKHLGEYAAQVGGAIGGADLSTIPLSGA